MAKNILGAALLAAWLVAGTAHAQATDGDAIARVVELNREGVAQYQKKHFDAARKALKQALELCESAGLDHHPVAARTHVHLGIVIIAGFGQREIGSRQFNEALQIQPDISLTPGLATPAVEDVFNEALVAVSPKSAPRPTAAVAPADNAPSPPTANEDAAPAPARPEAADDEVPPALRRAPTVHRTRDDEDDQDAPGGRASSFQIAALIGGGVGWTSGVGDVNADTHVPGSFAAAKLGHLELEGGYWLND
jgi:hypothetical protein